MLYFWMVLLVLLQSAMVFFIAFQSAVSVIGMLTPRKKRIAPLNEKQHRFAVLVCAHNEEAVVGQIVKNLVSLDYPKDKYDVFVICDNCTDNTAEVVRKNGGIAMERFNSIQRGKGYGLEWMFTKLWEMESDGIFYDAVIIFDADNLASRNFLRVMNEKLNDNFEVVQGYLDSKNPADTWITKSYAYSFWVTNHVYQLARERIGLSAQLGGTGLMVSSGVLKEIGWGATSLTEDLEFTARYVLTGKKVGWAHEAKIYDEKPLGLKASIKQRIRWMQGHIDCMITYVPQLMKGFFKRKGWITRLDMAVYLMQPTRMMISLTCLIFFFLTLLGVFPESYSRLLLSHWSWLAVLTIYYVIPILGLIFEGKTKHLLWTIPTYIFSYTWLPIIIIGFIKRKERVWSHTKHDRVATEEELSKISL